ncbi:MAG TPA: DUF5996 family protein [Acidisarcina sp.]|nr:DUF5996 family protein [Acidisarcina sp.]
MSTSQSPQQKWPSLRWDEWKDTADTLHMWTQIVGKVRLALNPLRNHWWNVPFYVSARGLTTGGIPYNGSVFDVEFDFVAHELVTRMGDGQVIARPLRAQSVAAFYAEFLETLKVLGIEVSIYEKPVEISNPIPFPQDVQHASYDPEYAHRFWQILVRSQAIFSKFETAFLGKASPVHFFWGSFDLAVTRFSGRPAPPRKDADSITREAYSHEVISVGFWPGNGGYGAAAFYAYAAPEPAGLSQHAIQPAKAFYDNNLKEFILKYDDVCSSSTPDEDVMQFIESVYDAASTLAGWDRHSLERAPAAAV